MSGGPLYIICTSKTALSIGYSGYNWLLTPIGNHVLHGVILQVPPKPQFPKAPSQSTVQLCTKIFSIYFLVIFTTHCEPKPKSNLHRHLYLRQNPKAYEKKMNYKQQYIHKLAKDMVILCNHHSVLRLNLKEDNQQNHIVKAKNLSSWCFQPI